MLKKAIAVITTIFLVSSCNMNFVDNIPESQSNNKLKGFSIKSTTNLNEIKKNFFPITRLSKQKGKNEKEIEKEFKFNFVTTSQDLKRSFILNVINGAGGLNKVGNIEVKVNGTTIIWNHDEDLNDLEDIAKIKKKLCKEDHSDYDSSDKKEKNKVNSSKITPDCSILLNNFFNRKTESLSASMWNIKEGNNVLEVKIKDERNKFGLDISVDGFLRPVDIVGAYNSTIPNLPILRKDSSYEQNGKVKIKFLEGMKIRVEIDNNGKQRFIDKNGINLIGLERILSLYKLKYISRITSQDSEELDQEEIKSEAHFGHDIPNLNLFNYLIFEKNVNLWEIIDEVKKLPYIEEASPDFKTVSTGYMTNDPNRNVYSTSLMQYDEWLKKIHVMTDCSKENKNKPSDYIGAWEYNRGKGVKIAILDGTPQISSADYSKNSISYSKNKSTKTQYTHEDFLDNSKNIPDNFHFISNLKEPLLETDSYIDHATSVLSIVAAVANNAKGTVGISNESDIISISTGGKKLNSNNKEVEIEASCIDPSSINPDTSYCNSFVDSIYLARKNGAKIMFFESGHVINGVEYPIEEMSSDVWTAIAIAVSNGHIILQPAGNPPCNNALDQADFDNCKNYLNGIDITYTIDHKDRMDNGSIIVGGVNLNNERDSISRDANKFIAKFTSKYPYGITDGMYRGIKNSSNYDYILRHYRYHGIDVVAPSSGVFTASYKGNQSDKQYHESGNGFLFGGTSAATPIVASIIALDLAEHPNLTPEDVRDKLHINGYKYFTAQSPNNYEVWNMIDAYKLLNSPSKLNPPDVTCGNFTVKNSAGVDVPVVTNGSKIEVKSGDQIAIPITPSIKNQLSNVYIGGIQLNLLQIVQNYAIYGIPNLGTSSFTATTNLIDIVIKNNLGQTVETLADALKILLDAITQTKNFPSSITVNGVTTNLDYGFNFDFNEASGNTVFDSSGKNNNGEFATLHGLLPLRTNSEGINFQAGSYITVPYSPSYNLPRKFAFLTTMKLHEKNRQQTILQKWEDQQINGQIVNSYGFYLADDNKITLTLSDNKSNYFSITHNADIPFDLEKEVGIAVIVDLDAKTVKMVKNQTIVDGNILYDGSWHHYSSLDQFSSIRNSSIPLSIGNYTTTAFADYSLSLNLNADLTNVASVISEVTPEQVSKIFYDMGLRD